jgi:hypothetical protein
MMLSFVAWVGDSTVLLPGLKLVAQAGIQILQVVQVCMVTHHLSFVC